MADNSANKAGPDTAAAGIPFYEKQRQHLKELIGRKRALEKRIIAQEEVIYQKETEYLENTPAGNIITGFDNYTKGAATMSAAHKKKAGVTEQNRVFSRSSISYNPAAQQEAQTPSSHSTPGGAPTPLSTSFKDGSGGTSGAPTPTSATAAGKASSTGGNKKKKTPAAAVAAQAGAEREDSDTDSRESKKVRTSFGAARK